MKSIRKSVTAKFTLITLVITAAFGSLLWLLQTQANITSIPTVYAAAIFVPIALVSLMLFMWLVARPLTRLHHQITNLLTGKRYHRLPPLGCDELGVATHFFNEVTKNLEKLSRDIIEQRSISADLNLASEIQKGIMPKESPPLPGLDVVAKSRAATGVGGDSFDFIPTEKHGTLMYIGDVSGHGIAAGLIMTMANTLMRVFAAHHFTPHEIIAKTNEMLHHRITSQRFMTMAMLRWDHDDQQMHFTGAGHEHLLVYRANDCKVEAIRTGGIALRMLPDISHIIDEQRLHLAENDVVLLYTDGITEGKNHYGEMFSFDRLVDTLQKNGHRKNSEAIFDAITEEYSDFIEDADQEDDVTMIVLRRMHEQEDQSRHSVKLMINAEEEGDAVEKWGW